MKQVVGYIATGILASMVSVGTYKYLENSDEVRAYEAATPIQQVKYVNTATPEAGIDFSHAAEVTVNSVVHVQTEITHTGYAYDPFLDYFGYRMKKPQQHKTTSSGSGVIISDDGYIVTNNHVIANASKLNIVMNNSKNYEAKVIGRDPATDLALLKIDAKDLPHATFGNSDEVRVGEWVLAVGNPFNLTSTVTAGIVSAKARNIQILEYDPEQDIFPIESFIQTDAAVNPGNSGGALVNSQGELIGINSAIASNTGSFTGYSFAIPTSIVKKVTRDLLEFGEVQRAFIGIQIQPMNEDLAIKLKMKTPKGIYIAGLEEGGAAIKAGLKSGDVITKIGNITVNSVPHLQEQIGRFRPGDNISVTILRDSEEMIVPVLLRSRAGDLAMHTKPKPVKKALLGATLSTAAPKELQALRLSAGVKVDEIMAGRFQSAGIREGFIISKVDGKVVATPDEVLKIIDQKTGGILIEGLYPNGVKRYYGLGS